MKKGESKSGTVVTLVSAIALIAWSYLGVDWTNTLQSITGAVCVGLGIGTALSCIVKVFK